MGAGCRLFGTSNSLDNITAQTIQLRKQLARVPMNLMKRQTDRLRPLLIHAVVKCLTQAIRQHLTGFGTQRPVKRRFNLSDECA